MNTVTRAPVTRRWLTRNVFAIGMLSLFSDAGHELTTAVLPLFLATFGGGAAALGVIEGFSDAGSSILKLWMSFYSDRVGKRKPILAIGYFVTAMMGLLGLATAVWQMVLIRMAAWMGRGARGPVRDALLSESVPPEAHGRAFGFETMMDTLGAIIGPAIALSLVGVIQLRHIFLIAFIPGAITVLIVIFLLKDIPRAPQPHLRIGKSLRELPRPFWKYVGAVGIFGFGNFAHTLLVLRAVALLTPAYGSVYAGRVGIGLYIFHNVIYAGASYPIGALGDRVSKKWLLAVGYALFGAMCIGFLLVSASIAGLAVLFALAGFYIAIVDSMERALAADLLPLDRRGTGYGALATVNSFGDLTSSIVVGLLWSRVSYAAGFWYAAVLTIAGGIALALARVTSGFEPPEAPADVSVGSLTQIDNRASL
ncbi:MAG: MFS transporter [Gemmatimonadaceae bacterium]